MRKRQAYFIGGGLSMLEGAAYCLKEGGFAGRDIHILGERALSPGARALELTLREAGAEIRADFMLCALLFEEGAHSVVTAIRFRSGKGKGEIQLREGDICVLDGEETQETMANLSLLREGGEACVKRLLRNTAVLRGQNVGFLR